MGEAKRSLCVLFADVSGSTRLYEKLGDKEALYAVERCLNRITRVTEACKGRLVKTIGDGIMAVFETAEGGVDAACQMQHRVTGLPPVSGIKLSIRAGLHWGPVLEEGDDFFGDSVNIAARVAQLANGGQIMITDETLRVMPVALRRPTREIEVPPLKGKTTEVRLHEVLWQEDDELTMKAPGRARTGLRTALVVRHSEGEFLLSEERSLLTMGRDQANDILILDKRASRKHARIERRREKFVVIDQSTNGTYVLLDGQAEFVLKREEAILRGQGRISFGHPYADDGSDVVEFQVLR